MKDTLSKDEFELVKVPGLDIQMEVITTTEGRVYVTPEGNRYPSASTISKILTRDAIESWRNRVGSEEADKKTKRGADRGTYVHLMCEKYLLGQLTPMQRMGMMPTMKELFLQLKRQFDAHVDKVYGVEEALYSDRLRIAGRTDGIVSWDGEIAILDVKTAAKPKPEDWILHYFVQTSSYAEMFEERTGIPVDKIVIAMAVEGEILPTIYVKSKQAYLPVLNDCIAKHYSEVDGKAKLC